MISLPKRLEEYYMFSNWRNVSILRFPLHIPTHENKLYIFWTPKINSICTVRVFQHRRKNIVWAIIFTPVCPKCPSNPRSALRNSTWKYPRCIRGTFADKSINSFATVGLAKLSWNIFCDRWKTKSNFDFEILVFVCQMTTLTRLYLACFMVSLLRITENEIRSCFTSNYNILYDITYVQIAAPVINIFYMNDTVSIFCYYIYIYILLFIYGLKRIFLFVINRKGIFYTFKCIALTSKYLVITYNIKFNNIIL